MKKIVLIVFVVTALFACSKKEMGQTNAGPFLAKVGSARITQADYDREFQALPDYAKQMFDNGAGKEKFLDEIVKKEILYQEALKKGMDKSPDFSKKLEEFKKLTLISELLQKEIMSKAAVSDKDVREYYDKHKQDFASTSQIKASHILVKTEKEAEDIEARLKKGEKFEDIARKESIDKASAKNGGDIGYFSKGQLVPEFERAAAALTPGQISAPVKTAFGYHIIKVVDKKMGPVVDFDRVKDIISQRLSGEKQKEAFDQYMTDLRKNYSVEVNKEALAKLPTPSEEGKKAAESPAEAAKPKEAPKK